MTNVNTFWNKGIIFKLILPNLSPLFPFTESNDITLEWNDITWMDCCLMGNCVIGNVLMMRSGTLVGPCVILGGKRPALDLFPWSSFEYHKLCSFWPVSSDLAIGFNTGSIVFEFPPKYLVSNLSKAFEMSMTRISGCFPSLKLLTTSAW